ncbi:MAG: TonB-dependent receptor [Desulfobacterales bacterium]|jgi:vitamin B12 transporter|nr:TonB-dependent receptor [Desulfobacterales bacterium]
MKLFPGKFIVFWVLFGLSAVATAQSSYEMKLLSLYFPQKDLVISATRYPKPISKTAENVTIVTADEIQKMNAHTVADVLSRVPGLFVNFTQDFGATSLLTLQGSEDRHVRVMLDGIQWNFLSDGHAETNAIPVGIIERIEIIKGPASSAWGSSLGGVINIITKQPGTQPAPTGSVSAAVGESRTFDYNAQVAGLIGPVGYYLYGGKQASDGLWNDREYDNGSFFSKVNIPVADRGGLQLSFGYSRPENDGGEISSADIYGLGEIESRHTLASLDLTLTRAIELKVSGFHLSRDTEVTVLGLGLGMLSTTAGELFSDTAWDEETYGGSAKLVWKDGAHVGVLGFDADHGEMDQLILAGATLQAFGVPESDLSRSDLDRWAVFLNDTITFGDFSITPGARFDHNSVADSFFSPSLGIAYNHQDNTIIRATLARGFNYPFLSLLSGGGLFLDPNPDLEPEDAWSYQLGFETVKIPYLWLRFSAFFHDQDKALKVAPGGGGPPAYNSIFINSGGRDRRGIELEVKTRPVYDVSLFGHWTYVDIDPANETFSNAMHTAGIGMEYSNPRICQAQLFGRYVDWDLPESYGASYGDVIWDLTISKKIFTHKTMSSHLFMTAHNLLNGSQYFLTQLNNPERWMEAGIRCEF